VGPSTGLPTRTSQGDVLFTYVLGHGDTRQVILLPGNAEECFEFGWQAFDLAEMLQTPIFVVSDLDLGINNWLADKFAYPDMPLNRGKTLDKATLEAFIAEHGVWHRWVDHEGDGVGYRTLPGTDHPQAPYFTRGTGHNEKAVYSERPDDYLKNMARLKRKFETARQTAPQPIIDVAPDKAIGIVSFGSNDPAIIEARDRLADNGIATNYLRIRALPLAESVREFLNHHTRVYMIENNVDGQMAQIMHMELPGDTGNVTSLALGDTLPMTADWVYDQVIQHEERE
jgi:2-oxoglutarate ferredoxin oxidoreductase subunit alpha